MVQVKYDTKTLFYGIRNIISNFGEFKGLNSDNEEGNIFVLKATTEWYEYENEEGESIRYPDHVNNLFWITIKEKLVDNPDGPTPKWKKATTVTIYKCVGQFTHQVYLRRDYLEERWLESKNTKIDGTEDLLNEYLFDFLTYGEFDSPKFTKEHRDKFNAMIREDYWYDRP